jgi:hypothetical protein
MKDLLAMAAIIVALMAYSSLTKSDSSQSYPVSQDVKGTAGIDYIRNNYASQISQARSLCTGQFKGSWIENSNAIGCFGMQGFSTVYCGMDIIRQLTDLCNSIGGSPVCSSSQASCSV